MLTLGVPHADVDDAVQQTFIVMANRLDDIVPGAEVGFLCRAAWHVASHTRRSVARRRQEPLTDRHLARGGDLTPEGTLIHRQLLVSTLAQLPEGLRSVLWLFEFERLTCPEIACLQGLPLGTVASRLRRARQRAKEEHANLDQIPRPSRLGQVGGAAPRDWFLRPTSRDADAG
jgi:RNA polymerase sigma-70 factor (ECF subfamily)